MSIPPPAPVKPSLPPRTDSHPPNGSGNGHDHTNGHGGPGDDLPPEFPKKRRSVWPFLLDLGAVLALFGFIITGRFLIVIGAVIFVVALAGWIREARADYSSLSD